MKQLYTRLMLILCALCALGSFNNAALAQATPPPAPSQGGGSIIGDIGGLIGRGATLVFSGEDGDEDPKKSVEQWRDAFGDPSGCWGCELYTAMQEVTLEVGQRGEAVFTSGAITAMNAFMGLWVVFQLYLLLSPTHANSPSQSINTIFQRIVLMMIVLAILNAGPFALIMEGFVLPSIDGIMSSAQALLGGASGACGGGTPGSQLICSMHIVMGKGMGLGAFLIDDANLNPFGDFEIFQLIGGLAIFICFAWMMLMLPFRLFDALIRIAVVSVILPVVVLAYQFKPTRGACKQAVTSVLAAALTFLFTAVAVAIASQLIEQVASPVIAQVTSSSANSYVGPIGAKDFMVLIAAACGMAAFIKQAGTVAAEFAGFQGSMGNVGNAAAGAFAGVAAGSAAVASYATPKGLAMGAAGLAKGGKAVGAAAGAGKAFMKSSKGGSVTDSAGQAR